MGQTTSHRLHGSSVIVFSQPQDDQKLLSSVIRGQPTPSYVSGSEIVILKSQVRGKKSVVTSAEFSIELNFVHGMLLFDKWAFLLRLFPGPDLHLDPHSPTPGKV